MFARSCVSEARLRPPGLLAGDLVLFFGDAAASSLKTYISEGSVKKKVAP